MKRVLVFLAAAASAIAQWQPVPHTQYPALETILNGKPAVRTGPGAPPAGCTPGLDLYLKTSVTPGALYYCDAANHWALAFPPHASSHGSAGADPVTPASIGALPTTGGTISGDLNVTGTQTMASAVLGPYTLAQLNALTPPVTAIAVVTDSANCTSQTIGQVQLCRYVSAGTWASIGGGGGGSTPARFMLCAGPCYTNETTNWGWTADKATTITGCTAGASGVGISVYPTGTGATTVVVYKNGTANSIFSGAGTVSIAGGAAARATQTSMHGTNNVLAAGDFLVAKVTGIAGTTPGQGIDVVCSIQ